MNPIIEKAIALKIRLLIEIDPANRCRVYYDKEDATTVMRLMKGRVWYGVPCPPYIRFQPIPATATSKSTYNHKSKPFGKPIKGLSCGKVVFFNEPSPMREIVPKINEIQSKELPLEKEIESIMLVVGPEYLVNISKNRVYLYKK